jgi:hypothetical protein
MSACESLLFFPLDHSFLCPDCSMVGNDPHRCPSCANEHGLMNLGAVLNRETKEEPAHD